MTQPSFNSGAGPGLKFSGWPDRYRSGSRSGPLGPILNGVWQSAQPIVFTKYWPRATGSNPRVAGFASAASDLPQAASAREPATARIAAPIFFAMVVVLSGIGAGIRKRRATNLSG